MRSLLKSPGYTVVVLLTLTLGLGANVAIFSVVNGVLLRPLDFHRPAELVNISEINQKTGVNAGLSLSDFEDWQKQSRMTQDMGALCFWLFNLTGDANPERLQGARASARLFQTLGVEPVLGRYFRAEDGTADRGDLVVLSNGLWKRRFGSRQDIVGEKLILNGVVSTVIGVMPAGFSFPDGQAELWAPLADQLEGTSRAGRFFVGVARIPSEGRAAAKAEFEAIAGRLAQSYPDTNANIGVSMVPWQDSVTGQSRTSLLILMGAVGFVLLIACVNVANLGFARAATRGREVAIRLALGGSRWRIVRQVLAEATVLAAAGGVLAWLLALAVVRGIIALSPGNIPRLDSVRLDGFVFAFTVVVALGSGILAGLVPALRASRQDINEALVGGGRSSTAGSGLLRLRGALVVLEVAAAMILLTGSGLLIRSFVQVLRVDLGYQTRNRLALRVFPVGQKYRDAASTSRMIETVLNKVEALPGVDAVATASHVPLANSGASVVRMLPDGGVIAPSNAPNVDARAISANYFHLMSIPLLAGRNLTTGDNAASEPVVIVNITLAKRIWPNENPVGKRVRWLDERQDTGWHRVVGVVGDVKQFALEKDDRPAVYFPYQQRRLPWLRWTNFVVLGKMDPANLVAAVRAQVRAVDPDLPVFEVATLDTRLAQSLAPRRFSLALIGGAAGLALVLGLIGVYGVISYAVAQRRQEIAIRMAVGATPARVLRLVLWQGFALTLAGVACGVAGSWVTTRYMSSFLFGVAPHDPVTFAVLPVILMAVSAMSCLVPALRASRVDPMGMLRAG